MAIDDDLLALERRLLREGAGEYLDAVDELKKLVALGSDNVAALVQDIAIRAASGALDLGAVAQIVGEAYTTAVLDGASIVRGTATAKQLDTIAGRAKVPPPADASGIFHDIMAAAFKARTLLAGGADPTIAAGVLIGSGRSTVMALSALIVEHAAHGATDVARVTGKPLVWVAERDACVRCLAHSGHVVSPGEKFPAGLSFGPYTYDDAKKMPPLHPHCRCHLEVLGDPSYAEALRREAHRSVLRGYSLESESMGIRVKAAKKLLDADVDAPKTVKAHAAAAIKRGKFNTRAVPRSAPVQPRQ